MANKGIIGHSEMNTKHNESFSTKKLYEHKIVELWDNPKYELLAEPCREIKERGFALQDQIFYGGIMFVGINPSFNKGEVKENTFYNPSFKSVHPYFRKFIEIGNELNIVWSHMDLLFIRETSQSIIADAAKNPLFLEFLKQQYVISKGIIRHAHPSVIVVNNTMAREWLKKDATIQQEFDEELGTYIITDGILQGTPIFYSSMFTGQRALDIGSYERLKWHIKLVLR